MASLLRFTPESSAAVPIDWSKIPEESKHYIWLLGEDNSLPQTIGDLAESFHEKKVFGYLGPELCQLLLDISEFGLKDEKSDGPGIPLAVGPWFYMKYGSEVWFLLFEPGRKGGSSGYSAKLPDPDYEDEDWEAVEAEKDGEVAEIFDKKLVDEVSRFGILRVLGSNRLAGWEAHPLESSLEQAQFGNAMMSLPLHHPARVGYIRGLFDFLRSCQWARAFGNVSLTSVLQTI
jgi:hypothetical protein